MKFIGKVVLGTIIVIVTLIVIMGACTAAALTPTDSPTHPPAAAASQTPAASQASSKAPAATLKPVTAKAFTVKGTDLSKSAKFQLDGDYVVTWTSGGGYTMFMLTPVPDDFTRQEMIGNSTESSGSTNVYGASGTYYLDAAASGAWTVTFTPAP